MQGKTEHPALMLFATGQGKEKYMVKWDSNLRTEIVPQSAVKIDIGQRSRRQPDWFTPKPTVTYRKLSAHEAELSDKGKPWDLTVATVECFGQQASTYPENGEE